MQKQPPKVFFKKGVMRNFAVFTRKHLWRNLFLLVFSCEFGIISKKTFFAEQQQMTASEYSSINSNEGSIGKRNCYRKYPNLVRTYVEIVSDPNYLVRTFFER